MTIVIFLQVSLLVLRLECGECVPTIGNDVWICPNVLVVCGGGTIGDNVLIAANSFVNFDVPSPPPDSIVICNPGKIIPSQRATEGCIMLEIII